MILYVIVAIDHPHAHPLRCCQPVPAPLVEAIHEALPRCRSCRALWAPCPVSARKSPSDLQPDDNRLHGEDPTRGHQTSSRMLALRAR